MRATVVVRTRWDDCDRNGHVNNAAYVALVRDAVARAYPGETLGPLGALEIEYRSPLPPDADVAVDLERGAPEAGVLPIHAALRFAGRAAATAVARWRAGPDDAATFSLPPIADEAGGRAFSFVHEVGPAEVGPDDTVRPERVLEWLEYAVYRAAHLVGWNIGRMRDADFITLQIGHHLALGARAGIGDALGITSRLVEMRRVSGTWHHEVRRGDGALVAADRSRGAFLDLAGRPRRAPEAMIAALLRGETGAR